MSPTAAYRPTTAQATGITDTTTSVSSTSAARPRYGDGGRRDHVAPAATVTSASRTPRRSPPAASRGRRSTAIATPSTAMPVSPPMHQRHPLPDGDEQPRPQQQRGRRDRDQHPRRTAAPEVTSITNRGGG